MPRIPKKLPFKKNYVYPEGWMYELRGKLPSWTLDARRGYRVGYYPDNAEITPIQGPMLPARVEAKRQAYLDALEDYRIELMNMHKEQEYNRTLPERARQLKQRKMDEFFGDANHPVYDDDVDRYFDDQVFEELDKRDLFY